MSENAPDTTVHPTTTHAEAGDGNPRLIFVVGSEQWDGTDAREFALTSPVTRIGSGADVELPLGGLDAVHAEIRHDDNDEYVLYAFGAATLGSPCPDPEHCPGHILRTGARVELGDWAMTFQRDEFADHGRPYGGRNGGEFTHQRRQTPRGDGAPVAPEEIETP